LVSDGLGSFTAAERAGVHERHVTVGGKASVKLPQFQAVNTLLSNLKTAMAGNYHAVKFQKYAHRDLAEVHSFNRRFDLRAILPRLVRLAATAEPRIVLALQQSSARQIAAATHVVQTYPYSGQRVHKQIPNSTRGPVRRTLDRHRRWTPPLNWGVR
jgi:hypothetical protein